MIVTIFLVLFPIYYSFWVCHRVCLAAGRVHSSLSSNFLSSKIFCPQNICRLGWLFWFKVMCTWKTGLNESRVTPQISVCWFVFQFVELLSCTFIRCYKEPIEIFILKCLVSAVHLATYYLSSFTHGNICRKKILCC